jgi:hypothetical protein
MIHELKNILWVENEKFGVARVLFLIDYGPEANSQFLCVVKKTGEFKFFDTNQVKIEKNFTLDERME